MNRIIQRIIKSELLNKSKIYKKAYLKAKLFKDRAGRKIFHKYGMEALTVFDKCMRENGFKYTLAFGTLLGAVREHGFIKHDNDIDTAMWIEDYSPQIIHKLEEYGFKLVHSFSVDDDCFGKEDTFEYKNVQIDIFYFYDTNEQYPYSCYFASQHGCFSREESIKKYGGLLPVKMYMPMTKEREEVLFNGIKVFIPRNAHEILSFRYGADYMTPIANWKPKTQYVKEWPEKLATYTEFK